MSDELRTTLGLLGIGVCALSFASAGCKRHEPEPQPTNSPRGSEAVNTTRSTDTASLSVSSALVTSTAPWSSASSADAKTARAKAEARQIEDWQKQMAEKYAKALAHARKLQSQGDPGAEAAFVAAAGKGQDMYFRAIAELGFSHLPAEAAEHELLVATTGPDAEVEGQAWFNLASYYQSNGQPEAERAALARSIAANPTPAAKRKLGQRSACLAEFGARNVTLSPAQVEGWVGVCETLGLCSGVTDETEARNAACLTGSGSASDPDTSHGCKGPAPWMSTYGHEWFTDNAAIIAPSTPGHFWVAQLRTGGWPAKCSGFVDLEVELLGKVLHVTEKSAPSQTAPDRDIPLNDPENGLCWDEPELSTHEFYDPKSNQLLAAFTLVGDDSIELEPDAGGHRVRLHGSGCDGSLMLDGSRPRESAFKPSVGASP
ncbi:MAG TPA: hypothetical protein VHM70_32195 [Polyangiaceae bacterium]|jgi:hypothetical protein|nr:hypothetical protein [Polyangiaceae bacterium]